MQIEGKPVLLDLFCGAGGASKGYSDAGFFVIGVDIRPQPNYPFPMIVADALDVMESLLAGEKMNLKDKDTGKEYKIGLRDIAVIHSSPPCQAHTWSAARWKKGRKNSTKAEHEREYPELIGPTRILLMKSRKPYVVENVPEAPLIKAKSISIDGHQVGLVPRTNSLPIAEYIKGLKRRRIFESNVFLSAPARIPRPPGSVNGGQYATVAGHGGNGTAKANEWRKAMGVEWMTARPKENGTKENPGNKNDIAESIPPAYTRFVGEQLMRHINKGE